MIYISLTTVPQRLSNWEHFKVNLDSLVNQKTNNEYKVILNIPYFYKNKEIEYEIPQELLDYQLQNNKLIINRVEEDYGPVVKLTGVLEYTQNPDDILIVLDDDQKYHEEMLEYHLKKRAQHPEDIICFRGDIPLRKVTWEDENQKFLMFRTTHRYFPVQSDCYMRIPGHWHSVGYKRSFFDEDFLSNENLSISVNDDIICSYYFLKKEIFFRCVFWDKEVDWRPVNDNGRGAWSFPIVEQLPAFEAFGEFRKQNGDHLGRTDSEAFNFISNYETIYKIK
jgi:hypothetical protein